MIMGQERTTSLIYRRNPELILCLVSTAVCLAIKPQNILPNGRAVPSVLYETTQVGLGCRSAVCATGNDLKSWVGIRPGYQERKKLECLEIHGRVTATTYIRICPMSDVRCVEQTCIKFTKDGRGILDAGNPVCVGSG
ncbi:hypothetical protein BGX38DRAFT_1138721 [Terfezia claveryi]|nr:hypothetical protein BGX38DRAFT_1138721 [Terfezia claveryi]